MTRSDESWIWDSLTQHSESSTRHPLATTTSIEPFFLGLNELFKLPEETSKDASTQSGPVPSTSGKRKHDGDASFVPAAKLRRIDDEQPKVYIIVSAVFVISSLGTSQR